MKRLYYTKTFMIFVELKKVNIFQTRLFYKMQCLIYAWIRGLSCVVTVHCLLNITFNIFKTQKMSNYYMDLFKIISM